MKRNVSGLLKTILQAGLYLVDQPERAARDVSDRVKRGLDEAGDRLSDVGDRLRGQDHTLPYALTFAAGIGVGVGVGMLLASDSGERTRRAVAGKFNEMGDRIKSRTDFQTGT
jgi:hypothetical protein